ncbi:hypothetical protein [Oligella sp. MSHR50489EDL]
MEHKLVVLGVRHSVEEALQNDVAMPLMAVRMDCQDESKDA